MSTATLGATPLRRTDASKAPSNGGRGDRRRRPVGLWRDRPNNVSAGCLDFTLGPSPWSELQRLNSAKWAAFRLVLVSRHDPLGWFSAALGARERRADGG